MKGQVGFWDFEHSLEALSSEGDPLEKLERTVCFEQFRPALSKAVRRSDPSKGGRPGFDVALKFKMLVLQGLYRLSLQQTACQVQDRLTWLRFCGLRPGDAVPGTNTLWDFREALIPAQALEPLFEALGRALSDAGSLAMGGQIIDATLAAAPRQRNEDSGQEAIEAGQIPEAWKDRPAKLRQKDREARWTVKLSKAKPKEDGTPQVDIATPVFGYKSHISIDRRHGIIRRGLVTDAAAADGARLREGLVAPNTASTVWADTAYRSKANEEFLADPGKISRIRRKKPKGKPMSKATARANAVKSKIRARIEPVFAEQKDRMGLFIRTIGKARAQATITLANIACTMKRWRWLEKRSAA